MTRKRPSSPMAAVISVAIAATSCFWLPSAANAECNADQVTKMIDKGFAKPEIDQICQRSQAPAAAKASEAASPHDSSPYPVQQQLPPFGFVCATSVGRCFMATAGPIGAPCTCLFPPGPVPGVIMLQ